MILADCWPRIRVGCGHKVSAESKDALRVGAIERDAGEKLCRHATTLAGVKLAARCTGAS